MCRSYRSLYLICNKISIYRLYRFVYFVLVLILQYKLNKVINFSIFLVLGKLPFDLKKRNCVYLCVSRQSNVFSGFLSFYTIIHLFLSFKNTIK